ncbi:putative imidazolonepropionase [Rhipicephalus microplus]|uniref:putative imidazolonepropionase n=1 Tax=Rhipicephalus microplus TaxID=6941 RepID=UPI003F6B940D
MADFLGLRNAEEATENIGTRQPPGINRGISEGTLTVENIDVFCEKGAFDVKSSRKIPQAGRKAGLRLNLQAEALNWIGRVECVSGAGIEAMAKAGSVAVVLPTNGVSAAIRASTMEYRGFRHAWCVGLEESLVAATVNCTTSLDRSSTHGLLEVGKDADMLVVEAPSWEHLLYRFGCHHSLIKWVVKTGKVVHQRADC